MLTKIVFTATIILFSFRIFYFFHKMFPYSKRIKHHVNYIIPVIELFAWFGFIMWCISYIYDAKNYLGLIVFGVILILISIPTFFLLRDFLFGVYLKIQRKIDETRYVEFGEFEGQIIESGHFSIDIKNSRGDIITIPYSKIKTRVLARHTNNSNLLRQKLIFKLPVTAKINSLIPDLEKIILNAPWSAASQPPVIQDVKIKEENYIIEVYVFVLKIEHAEFIREFINENITAEMSNEISA